MATTSMQPTLIEKRTEWLAALSSTDPHSIASQIHRLLDDAASFEVIDTARASAPLVDSANPVLGVQLNGELHNLLDRTFFTSQAIAIRRLSDSYDLHSKNKGGKDKSVYSLLALLKDMREHVGLFTRKQMMEAEGLEPDSKKAEQSYDECGLSERDNVGSCARTVPPNIFRAVHRHRQLSWIIGTENPISSDAIEDKVLLTICEKVGIACENVHQHVDKFIAHASTPKSRGGVKPEVAHLTFEELRKAYQAICEAFSFISRDILGDSDRWLLPVPMSQIGRFLDRPMVDAEVVSSLGTVWKNFGNKSSEWRLWGIEGYLREFGQSGNKKTGK